jgi:hypothetical protein
LKTQFLPALVKMMMEVEKDDNVWANIDEESELVSKDPVTTAISAISRLSEDLGDKTTL